jgi:hypothetical protein
MNLDRDNITDRLRRLGKSDRKRKVFGSAAHEYVLNPPLDKVVIDAFEAEHDIALPEDYCSARTRLFATSA